MTKTIRKGLLLTLKLVVAAALLFYVLRQVHWDDYVVTYAGKTLPVLALRTASGGMEVQTAHGQPFAPLRSFRPIAVSEHNQPASVLHAEPSWAGATRYEIQTSDGQRRWVDASAAAGESSEYIVRGFRTTILNANVALLLASAGCFVLPVLITSVRYWYLLKIQDIHVPLWEAVRLTFLGQFFSFVVPGTVSGDLVKAYYVARHTPRKAAVLVTVFVDRAVGLLEFAILPAAVMLAMWLGGVENMARFRTPAIMVAVVVLLVAASAGFLFSARVRRLMGAKWILSKLPLQKHMMVIAQAAYLYRQRAGALLKALAITFGGQFFFIVAILLAGQALGLSVSWYQYFLYVPLIYIVAAIPISPGGLGVTETFYVTFFSAAGGPGGVAASQILALALVARLIPMLVSLPGLVVALTGPKLPKAAQMKAELGT